MIGCWANGLNDCCGKISNEHIFSNCILDDKIDVQGFSWCKEEKKTIGSGSFKSGILCEKHNSTLSPYDTEALRFGKALTSFWDTSKKFDRHGFNPKHAPVEFDVNGARLEKWFCKTLVNVFMVNKEEARIPYDVILPFLYQDGKLDKPYGLYVVAKKGQSIQIGKRISMAPLFDTSGDSHKELAGGLFVLHGFCFLFLLPSSSEPFKDNKFVMNVGESGEFDWNDHTLNWHHREINQFRMKGKKSFKALSLEFMW